MTRRAAVSPVRRRSRAGFRGDQDLVAVESPLSVALRHAGDDHVRPLGILMRTPGDDEDLVTGFLYGETIVQAGDEIVDLAVSSTPEPAGADTVTVTVRSRRALDYVERSRTIVGTSACGLCGRLTTLALEGGRACPAGRPTLDPELIASLPRRLRHGQRVFSETGGLHAAALFEISGDREIVREDVGRHNAVDKAIGAALARGWLPGHDLLLAVSGRVAYEIVQKAVVAGLPAVAAIGAPSSLAVEAARATGLTLIGFVRGSRFNVYAGWQRLPVDGPVNSPRGR